MIDHYPNPKNASYDSFHGVTFVCRVTMRYRYIVPRLPYNPPRNYGIIYSGGIFDMGGFSKQSLSATKWRAHN